MPDETASEVMQSYLFHLFMRPSNTECAIQVCFSMALQCKLPVGDKLVEEFPKPLAVIMGEHDWMTHSESQWGKLVLERRGKGESYLLTPGAGHQMCFANPKGCSNQIINECLGLELPVMKAEEYPGHE